MPRSQSSTSSSKRSSSNVPSTTFRNPYSSVASTTPALSSTAPSLGQSVKEGFGLGVGSAVAHRVVASIFGAPTVNVTQPVHTNKEPCDKERLAFENCMKTQSFETFCGQQQLAYTTCIRDSGSSQ